MLSILICVDISIIVNHNQAHKLIKMLRIQIT